MLTHEQIEKIQESVECSAKGHIHLMMPRNLLFTKSIYAENLLYIESVLSFGIFQRILEAGLLSILL